MTTRRLVIVTLIVAAIFIHALPSMLAGGFVHP